MPRARRASRACGHEADLVLVEGAGSASEVNLRANDIANMGFARAADVPVVLIGDIDRGGVIASLVGTKAVIDPARRRAGPRLSSSTSSAAIRRCSRDGMAHDRARHRLGGARPRAVFSRRAPAAGGGRARARARAGRQAGCARSASRCRSCRTSPISTISIRSMPSPRSSWCACGRAGAAGRCRSRHPAGLEGDDRGSRGAARAPASTSTSRPIVRRGGAVLGLCGGYQMLGRSDRRSRRHRGPPGDCAGLGLLDVETMLCADKRLEPVHGESHDGVAVRRLRDAYGRDRRARPRAAVRATCRRLAGRRGLGRRPVIGTYVHGLFARRPPARRLARAFRGRAGGVAYEHLGRRRRSIAWPRISPSISTSTGSSACRDEGDERRQPDQQRVGRAIERERGPDIGGARPRAGRRP